MLSGLVFLLMYTRCDWPCYCCLSRFPCHRAVTASAPGTCRTASRQCRRRAWSSRPRAPLAAWEVRAVHQAYLYWHNDSADCLYVLHAALRAGPRLVLSSWLPRIRCSRVCTHASAHVRRPGGLGGVGSRPGGQRAPASRRGGAAGGHGPGAGDGARAVCAAPGLGGAGVPAEGVYVGDGSRPLRPCEPN